MEIRLQTLIRQIANSSTTLSEALTFALSEGRSIPTPNAEEASVIKHVRHNIKGALQQNNQLTVFSDLIGLYEFNNLSADEFRRIKKIRLVSIPIQPTDIVPNIYPWVGNAHHGVETNPDAAKMTYNIYRSDSGIIVHLSALFPRSSGVSDFNNRMIIIRPYGGRLVESLVLSDYTDYAKKVAKAYAARPLKDPAVAASYHALLPHIYRMYKRILNEVEVKFVDYDPYKSEDDLFANVHMKKVLLVTKLNNNHNPYWSPGDNLVFRAVHDYVVHRGGFHPFTFRGECGAYNRHVKLAPPAAKAALFSEIVGQVAVAEVTGSFPNPQKAAMLYGFNFDKIGEVDETEYQKNFEA